MMRMQEKNLAPTKARQSFAILFFVLLGVLSVFAAAISRVRAATAPAIVTYQGKLLVNNLAATTTVSMKFVLYDASSGGNALYSAGGTISSPTAISVTPTNGLFSVDLGGSGTNSLNQTIFRDNQSVYLEVTIGSETLSPRKQITAAPYAFNSRYLDGVGMNTVSSSAYIPESDSVGNFTFNTVTSSFMSVNGGTVYAYGSTGGTPTSGAGTRFMWIPAKAAFREGAASSTEWDDSNIGYYSTAIGRISKASGMDSFALGYNSVANAQGAMAIGEYTTASDLYATALGYGVTASAPNAIAIGAGITVSGSNSVGIGLDGISRTVNAGNVMSVMGGNVGIGTVAPNSLLTIANGNLTVGNGSSTSTISSSLSTLIGGFISNASSSIAAGLQVAGALNASGTLQVAGNTTVQNLTVNGTCTGCGSGTTFNGFLTSPLYVTNGSTTSTLQSNGLYIATSTSNLVGLFSVDSSGNVSASGTLLHYGLSTLKGGFISNASSSVGAGLQVAGAFNASSTLFANGAATFNNLILASGTTGNTPTSGAGTRLMWIPSKGAFRAGVVTGSVWDDANVGNVSFAFGEDTEANGTFSIAGGDGSIASGNNASVALGLQATASGNESVALGYKATASQSAAVAIGDSANASAQDAFAVGYQAAASAAYGVAIGAQNTASGQDSLALGNISTASGQSSAAIGYRAQSTFQNSFALGDTVIASNLDAMAFGHNVTVNGTSSVAFGIDTVSRTLSATNTLAVVGGNVFISGTSTASGAITTPTTPYEVYIDSGNANGPGLGVHGFIRASAFITATATLDLAETYPIDAGCYANGTCPDVGDAVCAAAGSHAVVEKCSGTHNERAIGIVSGNPGFTLGDMSGPTSRRIALAGRVPLKVSTANGPINVGDRLMTSDVPGVAVKAVGDGPTIGIALEDYTDVNVGMVLTFVNISWNSDLSGNTTLTNPSLLTASTTSSGQLVTTQSLFDLQGNSIQGVRSIIGFNNRWMIDENGDFITRVQTSSGSADLYAMDSQSREVVYTGSGQLVNGADRVYFTQDQEDIMDPSLPYHVTVTLTSGVAKGLFVSEKNPTDFLVKELQDGTSNATFDWMVVAERRAPTNSFSTMVSSTVADISTSSNVTPLDNSISSVSVGSTPSSTVNTAFTITNTSSSTIPVDTSSTATVIAPTSSSTSSSATIVSSTSTATTSATSSTP